MHLEVFADAASFIEKTERFLFSDEALHNLVLGSASTLLQSPEITDAWYGVVVDDANKNRVVSAGIWTPGRHLVISAGPSEAGHLFAEGLKPIIVDPQLLKGILADPTIGGAFLQRWRELGGETPHAALEMENRKLVFSSTKSQTPAAVTPGRMRRGWFEDLALLERWSVDLANESGLSESAEETATLTKRYVEGRKLFVWENQKPVAMASFSGNTPHGARMVNVFTPTEHRRKGYGRAIVYHLGRWLQQTGKDFVCLFIDKKNPAALALYDGLGYKKIGELVDYRFASENSSQES